MEQAWRDTSRTLDVNKARHKKLIRETLNPEEGFKAVGEFSNEYGERYVLLDFHYTGILFIAGDETDWKPLRLAQMVGGEYIAFADEFMFNAEEQEVVKQLSETYKAKKNERK